MCVHAVSPNKSNSAERLCNHSLPSVKTASDELLLVLCDGAIKHTSATTCICFVSSDPDLTTG